MALAKEFKQTEAGVIPSDWNVRPFGELIHYKKGYAFRSSDYRKSGVRVVRVSDTSYSTIEDIDPVFVSEKDRSKYAEWQLNESDLIFSTVGSKPPMYDSLVGKAVIVTKKHTGSLLNQNAVRIRSKAGRPFTQSYLLSQFRTPRYIRFIETIFRGNANQASLTLEDLFKYPIPLPPTDFEQEAIANALGDADVLIESLEKLIAKKRLIKKGAMQELLTGKRRLPGFSGEWAANNLAKLVHVIPGGIYGEEKCLPDSIPLPVATTAHISDEDRWNGKPMDIRFFTASHANEYGVRENDLLVVKSSGSAASIKSGKIALVTKAEHGKFIFSNFLMLLRPSGINPLFLYYYMVSENVKSLLPQLVEASTYPNLRRNEYLALRIPLPSPQEQYEIAMLLGDLDAGIDACEAKLTKARLLKQGMMQELLTGRIRLI